jgi:hypothetical protein
MAKSTRSKKTRKTVATADVPPRIPWQRQPYIADRSKSLAALRRELDDAILAIHVWDDEPGPATEALAQLRRILHELGRRGAEHVLDVGLGATAALVTELVLRLHARVDNELARMDGDASHRRLEVPQSVQVDLLPVLDSLAHLEMKLAESHAKLKHVTALAERGPQRRARPRKPHLARDLRGPAGGADRTRASRRRVPQVDPRRRDLLRRPLPGTARPDPGAAFDRAG